MPEVKNHLLTMLKAVLARRHIIICVLAVCLVAALLLGLRPLVAQRTAKPESYKVGGLEIESLTQVVGYRKVTNVKQSLSGTGRVYLCSYSYRAGSAPNEDIAAYSEVLERDYLAVRDEHESNGTAANGRLVYNLPTQDEKTIVVVELNYDKDGYTVMLEEREKQSEKQNEARPVNITPEQARNLVLSLTKEETGFKADISVYTTNLEQETVTIDGWDYYELTVIADYSETRIEYRGTFYVGCYDGIVISSNKETGVTSRLRGPGGLAEESPQTD